jgi:DNA-binding transcriptional regulator GbsR (MarR family)
MDGIKQTKKIKQVENNLKVVMKHCGLGEIRSSIYATLVLSEKPLTAKELAKRVNYAYTTTINALNHAIGLKHIKKMRRGRKNVYTIESNLTEIIEERLGHFLKLLEDTKKSIHQLDERYREKLREAVRIINDAMNFLRRCKTI